MLIMKHIIFEDKAKNIKVVDDITKQIRYLFLNDVCQGSSNLQFIDVSESEYMSCMLMAPYLVQKCPRNALFLGGGACLIPSDFGRRFGIISDVIDQEPVMRHVSENYFNRHPNVRFIAEEGKFYLEAMSQFLPQYDIIILDAFVGKEADNFLYSKEGLTLISQFLDRDGVIGINCSETVLKQGENKDLINEVFTVVKDHYLVKEGINSCNAVYFAKKRLDKNG